MTSSQKNFRLKPILYFDNTKNKLHQLKFYLVKNLQRFTIYKKHFHFKNYDEQNSKDKKKKKKRNLTWRLQYLSICWQLLSFYFQGHHICPPHCANCFLLYVRAYLQRSESWLAIYETIYYTLYEIYISY